MPVSRDESARRSVAPVPRPVVRSLPLLFAAVLLAPCVSVQGAQDAQPSQQLSLPTPLAHYQSYDWEADGRALFLELAASAPAETRARALALFQSSSPDETRSLDENEIRGLAESIGWRQYRPRLEEILLHGSHVLEIAPEAAAPFIPLIHDGLLFFLDHLSEGRLLERVVAEANLPRSATRGDRMLAFVVDTPSLQKLAQILARNGALAPDVRTSLQTLENGLKSAHYDEIMNVIHEELSPAVAKEYRIEFQDHLLAEASVGAVVAASYQAPGSTAPARAACKVLKARAVAGLEEDLGIIDGMLGFVEKHAEFYKVGDTPLVDIFHEVREALSREVQVSDERRNLIHAREYYKDDPTIEVPAVLPFSSPNVTCMEFVQGVKITDAFPGQPKERAILARRLSDALTFNVLFSHSDTALFHGDPHAGNVFHVEDGGPDPYRIALLDWGLAAEFTREERAQMIQLLLGLYLRDSKRLGNNVGVLVDFQPKDEEERKRMRERVAKMVSESDAHGSFALLDELITALAKDGYKVRYQAAIFIKSQVTISGMLKDLDPEFQQDDYVMGRITGQVFHETGPRLLRTLWFPAWNSHDYQSLISNEDVKDVGVKKTGHFFKKVGKGIWTAVSFQWLF
jgi:ubiquinone biosynthesis protein